MSSLGNPHFNEVANLDGDDDIDEDDLSALGSHWLEMIDYGVEKKRSVLPPFQIY